VRECQLFDELSLTIVLRMVWKCKLLILESDEQEFADQSQSELFAGVCPWRAIYQ